MVDIIVFFRIYEIYTTWLHGRKGVGKAEPKINKKKLRRYDIKCWTRSTGQHGRFYAEWL